VLLATAFIASTACSSDDDDTPPNTAGKGGSAGQGGSAGKGGSGGASGASEAGATNLGGEGGATESPLVARGDYLVNHVAACSDCHTPRDMTGAPIMAQYMAGAECFVKLPNGDCLHSRNLTNDATGLKNRTDDEIKKMIRDGIRTTDSGDEEALNPVMPYYVFHNITDDDMDAIVAFLRTIPAVEHDVPKSADSFAVPAPANYLDPTVIPEPDKDFPEHDSAMRGRYLAAEAGVCIECHTQHDMTSPDVLKLDMLFAGGESFDVGLPVVPVSANLTSDKDTGIGDWSADDIVKALLTGIDDEGKGLCPPMPSGPMGAFGGLTKDDATDIANYIKSLPAISNEIDDMCSLPLGQ
jgi:mono/diheme cytochrome c family protein